MMPTAIHGHQCVVISRNPVAGDDVPRHGSDIRENVNSSSNSTVLIHSSVRLRLPSSHHPCCSVIKVSGFDQLSMLPICPGTFPAIQTHRPPSVQEIDPSHPNQPSLHDSYASSMMSSTSHLSEPCRSVQLFVKSIRNTTISIHIASASSISDLKCIIYVHDGIPPCELRLMHRGRELRDDALLSGLDVDGATITCLLRVLGGNPYNEIPVYWWFGFSRSYEDGRAGDEGRIRHVLSAIEFDGAGPDSWKCDIPLSDWHGIVLRSGKC